MRNMAVKLIVIVGLALTSVSAANYGVADYYYQRAKDTYSAMPVGELSYARELSPVLEDVTRALDLRDTHADALDFKADLLYRSWWLSPDGQYLSQSSFLQQAAALHLTALETRQGWAFSSARLALIYSHQSKLDERFEHWFAEAHRLGLYETRVARSLMIIGLQNWTSLSVNQQELTMDFIRASIEQKPNSPQWIARVLDRYQKRNDVCDFLPDTARKLKACSVF